jgi:TRAP-type C4-dicarboxylate transport system substrate-binding protein
LAEALRSGEADVVLASCEDFLSLRLHEHARFATFSGNSLWTDFTPLLVSKKAWDSLTPQERGAMEAAAEASNRYFAAAEVEAEKRALAALEQAGVRVRQMSSEEYLGWVALAQRTSWAQYANASPASRALLTAAVRTLLQNGTIARASPVPQDAPK